MEKREPFFTVVRMQTGTATIKNSMEDPQKTKNRTTVQSRNSTSGSISKGTKTIAITKTKDMCMSMLITTLFIIARNKNSSSVHRRITG